ncbi:hypothetical protein HYDPIDRAFT_53316, partial [Hydnomerulius pinastri MD-312]
MSLTHLHECKGHMSFLVTQSMIPKGMIDGIKITLSQKNDFCKTYIKAKITRCPFPNKSSMQATKYSEWIHTDVW